MFFPPTPPAIVATAGPVCINCLVGYEKFTDCNGKTQFVQTYYSKFSGQAWVQAGYGYGPVVTLTVKPVGGGVYEASVQAM